MRKLHRLFILSLGLLPIPAFAETNSTGSDWNPTRFILLFIAVVLVFANALLAYVLRQLASAVLEKKNRERSSGIVKSLLLLLLFSGIAVPAFARDAAAEVEAAVAPAVTHIGGIPVVEFWFLSGVIGFLLITMIVLVILVRMLSRGLRNVPVKSGEIFFFRKNALDSLNKSVAIDDEQGIILDHDYDGIRELDNDLPPWWKWGFVATIITSFVYMGYYHVWGGPSQTQEYEIAVRKAEIEKAKYLAKAGDQVDETNVTPVLDPSELSEARELFNNVCAACHRADGGGTVGPNLTDDYWLHGGALQDVFKSVKYGWRDKGMPPWNGNLSARQIASISSYVKSLKGTKPTGGKAPQGELFVEGGDKAIDSLSNKTEPSLTPSGTTENKDNPIGPYKNKADGQGEGTPAGKLK